MNVNTNTFLTGLGGVLGFEIMHAHKSTVEEENGRRGK
jgi:hypothetical protein